MQIRLQVAIMSGTFAKVTLFYQLSLKKYEFFSLYMYNKVEILKSYFLT